MAGRQKRSTAKFELEEDNSSRLPLPQFSPINNMLQQTSRNDGEDHIEIPDTGYGVEMVVNGEFIYEFVAIAIAKVQTSNSTSGYLL